jgi:hypothetical protein
MWDHPEPRSAHVATLRVGDVEVTIMPLSVTEDGRGFKVFTQRGSAPLEREILFGDSVESIKQYISLHPERFFYQRDPVWER